MIVCVFDTETTGLTSSGLLELDKQPQVIEFAAVKVDLDTGDDLKSYNFLVRPTVEVTEEITNITNITNEMVSKAEPFAHYLDQVKEALEECDAVVAHNLSFDKEIIDMEMRRLGLTLNWPRLICTVEQSMTHSGYRLSLAGLYAALDLGKFDGAHRAMNDVTALVKCVKAMKNGEYI